MKKTMRFGAALCASLLLATGSMAAAEEKHIGDLIYVPAMTVQAQTGMYTLRVEGLSLAQPEDDPVSVGQVEGAQFGVYVVSSSGELTPWANPLYPSEPMRIRTGEGETRFSLPQGTEFFLRQESAPEGYRFDDQALIPVTDGEIVVRNAMAGQLVVAAADTLGQPIAGAKFIVTAQDGTSYTLISGEDGTAVLNCEQAGVYDVIEYALPEGVYEAISMKTGRESDVVRQDAIGVAVQVNDAARTRVTFEHPASGSVQLNMQLAVIDGNGETLYQPLAGVSMDIYGQRPMTIVTDETGSAQAALLEGEYQVRLSCADDAVLPVTEGMMIVESGATTLIELVAVQPVGRVAMQAKATRAIEGGSMLISSDATGEEYGPYALDADGLAVSDPLAPGIYHVTVTAPQDMQPGTLSCAESGASAEGELVIEVSAGHVTLVDVPMLVNEKQTYEMLTTQVGEAGKQEQMRVEGVEAVQLVGEDGETVMELLPENGYVSVQALTGTYTLRMGEKDAARLGVTQQSLPFELPSEQESIAFPSVSTRLILSSVDEKGVPVAGAVYSVTDSQGSRFEVTTDETGEAVTPLLAAGEVHLITLHAPELHNEAQETVVSADTGAATRVQMVHESYGSVRISLMMQKLDERGETMMTALPGATVEIRSAEGKKQSIATLVAGADGQATMQLPEGEYTAVIEDAGLSALRVGESVYFSTANAQETEIALLGYDAFGGLRVQLTGGELSDAELAQVRFELFAVDGKVFPLALVSGGFYAGNLPAGHYTLRQTQMPQGYTLGSEQSVEITGGERMLMNVPLEEYAVLSVDKNGLTFNERMQTFVVPLTGEYGVYVEENGKMLPYPSEQAQLTVWANVTPEQIALGKAAQIKLPAALEGTTYYLKEHTAAQGFAQDAQYHEITLMAGEQAVHAHTVSSDRGFFTFDQTDALTGAHVAGGTFELLDAATQETVLRFEMGEEAYRNPMAISVGEYLLRQVEAAPGYAMSQNAVQNLGIEPYLTQGGTVSNASMSCAKVPENPELSLIADLYAAQEQGLTLVTVDGGELMPGEMLIQPQLTIKVGAQGTERSDVKSVLLDGAGDAMGGEYVARVEYCLKDGGWQPSDARMTQVINAPVAVSLSDVEDDICAVRVTYLHAATGEEYAGSAFTPGKVTLNVHVGAEGAVAMQAEAAFTGKYAYTQQLHGELHVMERKAEAEIAFNAQGSGTFATAPAGKDGRISGMAFFDTDADGVMDAQEQSRYAGMTVSLLSEYGDVLSTVRTDGQGRYVFDALSSGVYTVQFGAGEDVVFSSGSLYSEHVTSSVADTRYGQSAQIVIDGEHTDYIIHAGCLFASSLRGAVMERMDNGEMAGFGGLVVEMRALDADDDEEPVVVVTSDSGEFGIGGILPGEYEVRIALEDGYLSNVAEDGLFVKQIAFEQGDAHVLDLMTIERGTSVSGSVHVDSDGDGVFGADAQGMEGIAVRLLRVEDGHTQAIRETVTDADGAYAFDMLPSGTYSVLFELSGEWAFTRYGMDSLVYGAAAQSGSTESFVLNPGQRLGDMNAGVTIPAMLSVSVFKDTQVDGQKGTYEEMLDGVQVSLVRIENGEDVQAVTAVTGMDGVVVFDNVSPGEYVLAYQMPGAWRATRQVDPATTHYPVSSVPQSTLSTGRSDLFTLNMGQKDAQMYIGAMLSGSISGTVYYDDNADAKKGEEEASAGSMLVELFNQQSELVGDTLTDENGAYVFEGLAPGRYRVRFTAQEGCGFAATERTMSRGGVQESDEHVASSRPITIASGDALDTADAGIVRLGTVSGIIWEDSDADRTAGEAEAMLSGVEVALMNGTGRNILATAMTDENGQFTFRNMRPGQYLLRVSAPEGYVFSGALETGVLPVESIRENRAYSSAFMLLGGAMVDNIGYGLFTQGTISGCIWQDADFDAMMESGEEGLRGAKVVLVDENGATAASATSQRSGEFVLNGLTPGTYTLKVELPEGYVFTRDGGASVIGHTGETTAQLMLGELAMGQTISDLTIGALRPAAVGGIVWLDQDDDGRRQVDDAGMQRIKAALVSEETQERFETYTDENGMYRFYDVLPGEYHLEFELPQDHAFAKNASGTKRVSCVPKTDALFGASDAFAVVSGVDALGMDVGAVGVGKIMGVIWEDSAYDGQADRDEYGVGDVLIELVDDETGKTAAQAYSDENGKYEIDFVRKGAYTVQFTLPEGMIFTCEGESAVSDMDSAKGKTKRFELAMGEGIEALNVGAIVPALVEGRLYVDANENGMEDEQEAGLSGAVMTLMQGGTVVNTCETDENGGYAFDAVRPGAYRVRMALPDETLFALDVPLALADPDALEGETAGFELDMGEWMTLDAIGTVKASAIGGYAWSDDDANGRMGAHEPALRGTQAELIALDDVGDETVLASAIVESNGAYAFDLLRSGTYKVRFTLPADRLFADYLGEEETSSVRVIPGNAGETDAMNIAMGEKRDTVNVGGILPGQIGDSVWFDANGNGLQDYREPLVPDVELVLLRVERDGSVTEQETTFSDQYGYYRFSDLRPGTYMVNVVLRDGEALTFSFGAPLGEIDSDVNPDTGMTAEIDLASGQTLRNIDIGLSSMVQ